ncbi:hypothetical protein FA95DRAFT_1610631 [Auriscalpium vulgare]|uniref:Uncharacterized protein n=1 Tax=Auriscalpium vulgare TaxID=40419 RepID=A0ACB8RDG5_9AGAM|nr:hypothetical protein FA95DRAFT_1610631 [Auriscalpium vulgare]
MSESCGNPNVESEAVMPRKAKFDKGKTCVKCKENPGNLVIRHAVYCKDCFGPLISSRFRHALEPHINATPSGPRRVALKPTGDLLVGFSGGLGSTVLLDLVHHSYLLKVVANVSKGGKAHPRNNERVWKNVRACYVEIADAFPGMKDRIEDVRAAVGRYDGVEFVPVRIQDAFDPTWWEKVSGKPAPPLGLDIDLSDEDVRISSSNSDSTPISALHSYLRKLPTPTAVHSTISTLIRILLLYTAHATTSSHLVQGTSLTSLSINLISSISQGGGFVVPQVTQEEWFPRTSPAPTESATARRSVRVIRPLRDIGMKECAAWAWWNQLPIAGKQKVPVSRQTIDDLTKDFIVGLEKDFPSTVSTIAKTVAKLAPKGDAGDRCVMCELPTQRSAQEWKARIAIRSFTAPDPSTTLSPATSLSPLLCYSCHTTLTSRSSRGAIPAQTGMPVAGPPSPLVPLPAWTVAHLAAPADTLEPHGCSPSDSTREGEQHGEVWEAKKLSVDDLRTLVGDFMLDDDS